MIEKNSRMKTVRTCHACSKRCVSGDFKELKLKRMDESFFFCLECARALMEAQSAISAQHDCFNAQEHFKRLLEIIYDNERRAHVRIAELQIYCDEHGLKDYVVGNWGRMRERLINNTQ